MILIEHEYHGIELTKHLPSEHYEWLVENFGNPDGTRWYTRNNIIYFASELDHMMVLMRIS